MDELAKRFADLAEKFGPNVADAALSAARVEAFSQLTAGLFSLLVAGLMAKVSHWLWLKAADDHTDKEILYVLSVIVGGIACFPAGHFIWTVIDPWTWTTILHPELWIAKRAFHI